MTGCIDVQKKKKIKIKRTVFIVSFLIMPCLNFLIFYLYVNLDAFTMAFRHTVRGETVWGLTNFRWFFNEFTKPGSELLLALKNTMISFGVILVMFPVSFLVSFFIYKKVYGYRLFRFLFFIPTLIQGTVVAAMYVKMCNNTMGAAGPLSRMVQNLLGLEKPPSLLTDPSYANLFVMLNIVWLSFPGDMVIWGGTFSRIPDSVLESARLDGVGWVREAAQIIVPIVWPTFALKLVLSFVGIFGASGNVFLLTDQGKYGTQTLANWMYMQVFNQNGNLTENGSNVLNQMSAVGLIITVATMIISMIVRFITNHMNEEVTF